MPSGTFLDSKFLICVSALILRCLFFSRQKGRRGLGFLLSVWFPVWRWEDVETVATAFTQRCSSSALQHPVTSTDWLEVFVCGAALSCSLFL